MVSEKQGRTRGLLLSTLNLCYPTQMDWQYDLLLDLFWHPETGVVILGEDMPEELYPNL